MNNLRFFICYRHAEDQITALRLQTIGVVYGLTIYVPPLFGRKTGQAEIDPDALKRLEASSHVIIFGSGKTAPAARAEMDHARLLGISMSEIPTQAKTGKGTVSAVLPALELCALSLEMLKAETD